MAIELSNIFIFPVWSLFNILFQFINMTHTDVLSAQLRKWHRLLSFSIDRPILANVYCTNKFSVVLRRQNAEDNLSVTLLQSIQRRKNKNKMKSNRITYFDLN